MENIITLNRQNNILTQEEIETLLKGFIKLIEKNTEQKIKNTLNFSTASNGVNYKKRSVNSFPNLNVDTIKDLEDIKNTALKIFKENERLKKQIFIKEEKIQELRSMLVKNR